MGKIWNIGLTEEMARMILREGRAADYDNVSGLFFLSDVYVPGEEVLKMRSLQVGSCELIRYTNGDYAIEGERPALDIWSLFTKTSGTAAISFDK